MAEILPRPDAPAVMRKLPDRRAGTTSPAFRLGPDVAAASLGLRPDGVASVSRRLRPEGAPARESQLRPDGAAAASVELRPDGTAAAGVEHLPSGATVPPASPRARPSVVEPLAPARYKVQFTASAELRDKLERLRALMRPSAPDGDLAAIVEQAVTEKLQRLEARRFARTQAPRKTLSQSQTSPTTRQIPAAVKRAVYERDGGRCRYEDEQGRRCPARQGLEYHHRRPFGHGDDPRSTTSPSRANATTATWPRSTTVGTPWLGTAAREPVPRSRHRLRRRDDGRSRESRGAPLGLSEFTTGNAGRLEG